VRRELLPHDEWIALVRDAHPGYISWEQYLLIDKQFRAAATGLPFHQNAPPREGPALLQGRAVCGLCGQRMHVRYGSRRGQLIPNYVWNGRGWFYGDALCQSIVGVRIDAAISKLIVDSLTPTAIDLTLAVQKEIERRADESDRLRHRQVERAQYEADQARQRYMLVDPSNRLVADSLEAEWNARLRALSRRHSAEVPSRLSSATMRSLSASPSWTPCASSSTPIGAGEGCASCMPSRAPARGRLPAVGGSSRRGNRSG
jgi:hypothetical protein